MLLRTIFSLSFSIFALTAIAKDEYIVTSEPEYIPFAYLNEDKVPTGFDIDILNAIAKAEKITFSYKTLPWSVLFDTLEDGRSDIITSGIGITEERKALASFTNPYLQSQKYFILGDKIANIHDIEQLKNYTIGVKEKSTSKKTIEAMGFTKVIAEPKTFLAIKKVLTNANDAAVSDFGVIKYYQKRYSLNILPIPNTDIGLGFAVKKDNQELLEKLNRGLESIKASGEYDIIYNKYFSE